MPSVAAADTTETADNLDIFTADFSTADGWVGDTSSIKSFNDTYQGIVNENGFGDDNGWGNAELKITSNQTLDLGSAFNAEFNLYSRWFNTGGDANSQKNYSVIIGKFEIFIHGLQTDISVQYNGIDIGGTSSVKDNGNTEYPGSDTPRDLNYRVHIESGNIVIESELIRYESSFADFEAQDNVTVSLRNIETWQVYIAFFRSFSVSREIGNFETDFSTINGWTGDTGSIQSFTVYDSSIGYVSKNGFGDGSGFKNSPVTITTARKYNLGKNFDASFTLYTNYHNGNSNWLEGEEYKEREKNYSVIIGDFEIFICAHQTNIIVTYKGKEIDGTVTAKKPTDYVGVRDYNYSVHFEPGYILIESDLISYVSSFDAYAAQSNASTSLKVIEEWYIYTGFFSSFKLEGKTAAPIVGDIDSDGDLLACDLTQLKKTLLGNAITETKYADVTRNGIVDIIDLVRLKKMLVSYGINNPTEFIGDFKTTAGWSGAIDNIDTENGYYGKEVGWNNPTGTIIANGVYNLGDTFKAELGIYTQYCNNSLTTDKLSAQIGDFTVETSAAQNAIFLYYNGEKIGEAAQTSYFYGDTNYVKDYTYKLYVTHDTAFLEQYDGNGARLLYVVADLQSPARQSDAKFSLTIDETYQIYYARFTSFKAYKCEDNVEKFVADFTDVSLWEGERAADSINTTDGWFGEWGGSIYNNDSWNNLTGSISTADCYDLGDDFTATATIKSGYKHGSAQFTDTGMNIYIGNFKLEIGIVQNSMALYDGNTLIKSVELENPVSDIINANYSFSFKPGEIVIIQEQYNWNNVKTVLELKANYDFAPLYNAKIQFEIVEEWQSGGIIISEFSALATEKKFDLSALTDGNGIVTFEENSLKSGATALITVTPNSGYALAQNGLSYSYTLNGKTVTVELEANSTGFYSIKMPKSDVIFNASFISTDGAGVTLLSAVPNNENTAHSTGIKLTGLAYYADNATEYGFLTAKATETEINHETAGVQVLSATVSSEITTTCDEYSVNLDTGSNWIENYTVRPYVKVGDSYIYAEQSDISLNGAVGFTTDEYTLAAEVKEVDGKNVIYHNGTPHMYSGVQAQSVRILDYEAPKTQAEYDMFIEPYFIKAKELGYNTLVLSISWRSFEKTQDSYNFDIIKYFTAYANEYELNLQLLWFGSDVCGRDTFVPQYIKSDAATYSLLYTENISEEYYNTIGYPLDYSDPDLIYREKKAFSEFLRALRLYDTESRTLSVQVGNECNGSTGQVDEENEQSIDKYAWIGGQKNAIVNIINELAVLTKTGAYRCISAINLQSYNFYHNGVKPNEISEIVNNTAIDSVGFSLYNHDVDNDETYLSKLSVGGNIGYIAESDAASPAATAKMLYSAVTGNGLIHYELMYTHGYSPVESGDAKGESEYYALRQDGTYRDGTRNDCVTTEIIGVNKMLSYMSDRLIVTADANKKVLDNDDTSTSCPTSTNLGAYNISYTSANKGVALVAFCSGELYLYSTREATFTFENGLSASIGYYNNGVWTEIAAATGTEIAFSLEYAKNGYTVKISQ